MVKFYFFIIFIFSKMMSCRLNHNLICLGLEPLFKGLRTNLNAQFHWTLLLGPLFKMALIVDPPTPTKCVCVGGLY